MTEIAKKIILDADNNGPDVVLGIDDAGNLYVNNERVKTEVKLDWLVLVPAWGVFLATVAIALCTAWVTFAPPSDATVNIFNSDLSTHNGAPAK